MLDTIQCSVIVPINYSTGKWIPHTDKIFKYKSFWRRTYNGITFQYYPHHYKDKVWTPLLTMSFSAATMQNGINVIPYNFDDAIFAVREIEKTIYKVTGRKILLQDIKTISRIDINKNIKYRGKEQKQALRDFFGKLQCDDSQSKVEYDTGFVYGNDSVKCRFYFKDEDENLGEEILAYMPPTARLEFQLHRYRIQKYYPEDISLYVLLTKELYTARAWNGMLDEYRIGGEICNSKTLFKRTSKLFNNTKRIKSRKLRQLRQLNDTADTTKHRAKTIAQTKSIVKELDEAGICPYSCEMRITLKEDILQILLKKRTVAGSICHTYLLPHPNPVVFAKKHIDSS